MIRDKCVIGMLHKLNHTHGLPYVTLYDVSSDDYRCNACEE